MRRRRLHSPGNHDRWLVSYADFITLLFAFFVVMFASNQAGNPRAKALSESIQRALKDGVLAPRREIVPIPQKNPIQEARPDGNTQWSKEKKKVRDAAEASFLELSNSLQTLQGSLKSEIENGAVHVSLEGRGLIISLEAAAFFPSGSDAINTSSYKTIGKVADVLQPLPNTLRLEGHTDSLPISSARFQSNWELSAARSIAMLRILGERFGIERQRMAIVGYADTEAVGSNETEEGRGRNRRVDIVVLSRYGMQLEPAQAAAEKGVDKNSKNP